MCLVLLQGSGPSSPPAADFTKAYGRSSGLNHFAGPIDSTQVRFFPPGDPFPYAVNDPLAYDPLAYDPLAYGNPPTHYNDPSAPYYNPSAPSCGPSAPYSTPNTADPNYTRHTGWPEQSGPPFHRLEHLQAMGHHQPCIAQRIARKVYGIDPDRWSRKARSFVL